MLATLGLLMGAAAADARVVKLPAPNVPDEAIALHCVSPPGAGDEAVLFIHGASFPTELAFGFEFEGGDSWMDFTARRGFVACGLDFLGFGASGRPPEMSAPSDGAAPLLRAPQAADEIAAAAEYMREQYGSRRLHVVAHSWGTIPAAAFAAEHPAGLASLTLFGPVVPMPGGAPAPVDYAWWSITAEQRYEQLRYAGVLPDGLHLLEPAVDEAWASRFAQSQPGSLEQYGEALRIPAGPIADLRDARAGLYPYDPGSVEAPVFVVYGNYDTVVDDAGAAEFLAGFTSSPLKWRLRIDEGTHVMHLERNRWSLYRSVAAFIDLVEGRRDDGEVVRRDGR